MQIMIPTSSMMRLSCLIKDLWRIGMFLIKILASYFSLICLTIWVVLGFSSGLVWNLFKDLPTPPKELDKWI